MTSLSEWQQYMNRRKVLTGRTDDYAGVTEQLATAGLADLRRREQQGQELNLAQQRIDLGKQSLDIHRMSVQNQQINDLLNYNLKRQALDSQDKAGKTSSAVQVPLTLAYAKRLYDLY